MPLLEVSGLSVRYDKAQLLNAVSLSVNDGELVGVVGPNGAGKSNMLRAISGLVQWEAQTKRGTTGDIVLEGSIKFNGEPIETLPAHEIRRLGLVLFPRLKERSDQVSGTLSGGEQQMLSTARALMFEARLLCIDEPSLGLAPKIRQELFAAIEQIHRSGIPVLLVEQEVGKVFEMADRNYVLSQGKIIAEIGRASCR